MAQLLSNILVSNNSLLLDSVNEIAANNQSVFNFTYTPPFVEVYLNGVKLIKDTDFTASNGSAIVLTEAAAADDVIEVVKFSTGNIYGQSTIVAGTNISGGGTISGGNNVTLNLDTSLTSLTSVQTETLTNASGNLLVDTATQKTEFRGDGSSTVGAIQLNCEVNTHGQTIKPQPHSALVTNELTLPAGSNQELVGTSATQTLSGKTLTGATLNGSTTINGATTANSLTVTSTTSIAEVIEKVDIPTSTTGTIAFDLLAQAVQLYNTNQTANRTINFRGDSTTSLDSVMAVGESMTAAVLMKQGGTAYYLNAFQIDGASVTPEWSGGSAPSSGNANSIDAYLFTIIKTASATFTVLASQTQYA